MIANINKVAQNETKYGSNCLTPVRSHRYASTALFPTRIVVDSSYATEETYSSGLPIYETRGR